jgi:hypothetical protein
MRRRVKALAGVPHGVSLAALASCIVLAACIPGVAKLHQSQDWAMTAAQADPPSANERVVVLSESGDDDQFGTDCARTAVADRTAMPAGQFRKALSPWFEPKNLPKSEADLGALLDREHVRDAISSAGVRYIVTVNGDTYSSPLGPVSPLSLAFEWDRRSSITFEVWDLKRVKSLGRLTATTSGNNYYGVLLMMAPMALWAPTETATCDEITRGLHTIFEPLPAQQEPFDHLLPADEDTVASRGGWVNRVDSGISETRPLSG